MLYPQKGEQRSTIIELFIKKLAAIDKVEDNREKIAINLEKGCFNKIISHCKNSAHAYIRLWSNKNFLLLYSTRCGIILNHVKPGSYMIKKIINGEWKPEDVGKYNEDDLDPEVSAGDKALIEKRSKQKVEVKISALYKCPKCGLRESEVRTVQARSADEAQTVKAKCVNCNTVWNAQ